MKKGLIIASIASVMAISAGCAFAISANRGIRFEAAKADPETETVLYDKDAPEKVCVKKYTLIARIFQYGIFLAIQAISLGLTIFINA